MKLYKKIIKSLFFATFLSQSANANTDIDLNKDGLVDEEHYATNLLLNADFTQSGDSWEVSGIEFHSLESRSGADSTMLASTNSHRVSEGSATQVITLADAGFSDTESLDTVLTLDYEWQRREGEAVIPAGTRAISYKVELYEPGTTIWNRVDDAYVHIQPAEDNDLDFVLDYKDVDKDNDGLIDEEHYATNLLSNGDFTKSGESWEMEA
ncbi:hypothetical protein I635_17710 [Alteromonas mediterranea UM7]|uniref:hypothetical protein n=1 Tax=Alteromonas mediterranea TaxID=314275 RepID=UPI0003556A28|nr:hypothetical protein [Alteromonas mediterranea]AGP99043.1 hypothetical protein I635_17710 [Alteromonas mediterranea UM7]